MSTFTDALLAAEPAIPGLDATVVVPARRMHFTLGVMSLDREGSRRSTGPANGANADSSASESDSQPKRTSTVLPPNFTLMSVYSALFPRIQSANFTEITELALR